MVTTEQRGREMGDSQAYTNTELLALIVCRLLHPVENTYSNLKLSGKQKRKQKEKMPVSKYPQAQKPSRQPHGQAVSPRGSYSPREVPVHWAETADRQHS